ncbi:type VI secretion system protein TssA [Tateyamaria sp. ANG-S1]|uniref:type VI secretion system protein TssA n=1 Tax=Tateyamaria sp. ANG-S1 TaxID=1577905 RepID=UPI00057CCC6C|nr:type VI secretion system protein TssA [Tateyamaria sp. ANG-S1]KIC47722.1 type VI secretion protein [Tateyamaria sp. ANG-S1]
MDVDTLLQTLGEDAPSGDDLEYDPAFMEMEIAAQPGEERQVGDEILPAEDPDYKDVQAKALAVLERSHDLRAGIVMAETQLRLSGWPGFAKAISYLAGCLSQYWDTCHPQLDADDDDDPTMRINAVLSLTDDARILRGVRRAPLTQSRTFGAISLRDIAVAEGDQVASSDMDSVPDPAQVAAAFQDTDDDVLTEIAQAVSSVLSDLEIISATFDEHTPGQGPDLDPLIKFVKQANTRLANARGVSDAPADGDTDTAEGATEQMATAPVAAAAGVGGINSPTDVQNALDRIIGYYERCEPSSPLPLLLLRAKKLVNADFLSIVKDMAPNGIENVHLIGGIEEDDD